MLRKSLIFGVFLAVDIATFAAILQFVPFEQVELKVKIASFALAHWFLACFLFCFGSLRAPWRQGLSTFLLVLLCAVVAGANQDATFGVTDSLVIVASGWLLYFLAFFPRRLWGMRIGFSKTNRERRTKRQFGIGTLLGLIAAAAVPLAIGRIALNLDSDATEKMVMFGILAATLCVIVTPLSISLFSTKHVRIKFALSLAWCLVCTFALHHLVSRNWLQPGPTLALIWIQIAAVLLTGRLLGLRWEGKATKEDFEIPRWQWNRFATKVPGELMDALIIAGAILAAGVLVLAPLLFQVIAVYVVVAAAPLLIITIAAWRRTWPTPFWKWTLIFGMLPWLYAMVVGTREATVLLWDKPFFVRTAPVEVRPASGLNWIEVLIIFIAPLVIGGMG